MASVDQGFAILCVPSESKITPASPQPNAASGGAPATAHGWYGDPIFANRQPGLDFSAILFESVQGLPAGDKIAPVITYVTASPIAQAGSIVVDVTDNSGVLGLVSISVTQGSEVETIFDGSAFVGAYAGGSSSSGISQGTAYTIVRAGGWLAASITVKTVAVDGAGNMTTSSQVYATGAVGPSIAFVTTSPIAQNANIVLNAFGEGTHAHITVTQSSEVETAFDGAAFVGHYSGSSASNISSTQMQVTLVRAGGWTSSSITVKVAIYDALGNQAIASMAYTTGAPTLAVNFVTAAGPIAQSDPVVVDVTGTLGLATIYATLGGSLEEVYNGSAFVGAYATSSTASVTGGTRFTIRRTSGWNNANLSITAEAVDVLDNLVSGSRAFTTGVTPIAVGNYVPTPGTPVDPSTPIQFDVTDGSAPFRRIIVTIAYPTGDQDVAFDGRNFVGRYILSSRSNITNGFRFAVQRIGGWAYSPTIQAYAYDQSGSEGT